MAEARCRFARCFTPQALASDFGCGRGKPLGGFEMRSGQCGERHGLCDEQFRQRRRGRLEPVDKPQRRPASSGESRARGRQIPARDGVRGSPASTPTREIAESDRRKTPAGERMFQRGQQRHRSELAGREIEDEAQKNTRRGPVQRQSPANRRSRCPSGAAPPQPAGRARDRG